MNAILCLAWVVLRILVALGMGVAFFAAIMLIGFNVYFEVCSLGALLGAGAIFAWQAGIRQTLLILGAGPALAIRFFPLVLVAIAILPLIAAAVALLAPLLFLQLCINRAL